MRFLRHWIFPVMPSFLVRFLAKGLFSKSGGRLANTTRDPSKAQQEVLLGVVKKNAATVFGREHNFDKINNADDYRRLVPIRTYDELAPYINRMADGEWRILTMEAPTFFGRTSGTTGPAKLIPVTASFRDEYKRSRRIWYRQVALAFPKILRGPVLSMRSPKIEGKTRGGIPFGSVMVGLQQSIDGVHRVAEEFEQFPTALHLIEDFDARYYAILRHALSMQLSMIHAINPSTIVLLCRKLDEHAEQLARDCEDGKLWSHIAERLPPSLVTELERRWTPNKSMARKILHSKEKHGNVRAIDVWPRLTGLMTWKAGPAGFYLQQLPRWFGDLPIMCWGYLATEGGFSIPLDAKSDDGVLAVMSHFMEFVEESAWERGVRDTKLAHELEVGAKYRVIITGSHGLYRYDINDVVEVTGMYQATPRVRFSHKSGTIVSITGEKLTEPQVATAVTRAAKESGVEVVGFTLALRLGDPPRYVCAVEPKRELDRPGLEKLRAACDSALGEANIEYAAKRKTQRLGELAIALVERGSFDAERARRVSEGSPDAHVKIPYLQANENIVGRLRVVREVGS